MVGTKGFIVQALTLFLFPLIRNFLVFYLRKTGFSSDMGESIIVYVWLCSRGRFRASDRKGEIEREGDVYIESEGDGDVKLGSERGRCRYRE
jgi:hypothetical protein